jgi:hypothetical protein
MLVGRRHWAAAAVQSTTIPCEGTPTHAQVHDDALAALALHCTNVTSCPEGGECAEAVKALTDYYTECNVAEDDAFETLKHAGCHCIDHHTDLAPRLIIENHENFEHDGPSNPDIAILAPLQPATSPIRIPLGRQGPGCSAFQWWVKSQPCPHSTQAVPRATG